MKQRKQELGYSNKTIAGKTGLPIRMTTVEQGLFKALEGKIEQLFPLRLQDKIN